MLTPQFWQVWNYLAFEVWTKNNELKTKYKAPPLKNEIRFRRLQHRLVELIVELDPERKRILFETGEDPQEFDPEHIETREELGPNGKTDSPRTHHERDDSRKRQINATEYRYKGEVPLVRITPKSVAVAFLVTAQTYFGLFASKKVLAKRLRASILRSRQLVEC
jgi:hypothetical protein